MHHRYCVEYRPGGELNPGEDDIEGLKRLLTEVATILKPLMKLFKIFLWIYCESIIVSEVLLVNIL